VDPDPNGFAMLFFGLSFMMFFFALVPIILGFWIGAAVMAGIGMALVGIGLHMIRTNKRAIEVAKQEAMAKIKCRYCGSLNDQKAERCFSCGADL
jgi:ribosomal protein L40E